MNTPRIIDTVLFHDELDMLECRLHEIGDIIDHMVLVEATTTFRGDPKPLWYRDNQHRFAQWADKIVHVVAADLPPVETEPDPWQREYAQRDRVFPALQTLDLEPNDIVLHGDVDEIPRRFHLRNVRPTGLVPFGMRFHPFAVDWLHPDRWPGTMAVRWWQLQTLAPRPMVILRNARFAVYCPPHMADAGWHFSWVGDPEIRRRKLVSFSHHEIVERTEQPMSQDRYRIDGQHVDGVALTPVDVDDTWPAYIRNGLCPAGWFRPKTGEHS